jgi:hypothetical protein
MYEGYQKIKKNLIMGFNRVSEISKRYQKYWDGIGNIRRVSEMYEGYRKIKKTKHWVSIGYRKYPEGIENIRGVLDMYKGYLKY